MNFHNLIKEICEEEGITCQVLSNDYYIMLSKKGVQKYIIDFHFSLNNESICKIIDDKYAFYTLAKNLNIPILEHMIVWSPTSKYGNKTKEIILKYFYDHNENIVLKPNIGRKGNNIYHVEKKEELENAIDNIFKDNFSISICPYYECDSEYRVIILDNEVKLMYEKVRPIVIGDGKKKIKELLLEFNYEFFKDMKWSKEYERILAKEEKFVYDWRFNLSKGASARLVLDKELKEQLKNLALLVTKKIGVKFVSVDIVKWQGNLYLMELNSGVGIRKVCNFIDKDEKIRKSIYKEAIIKMFLDD